LDFTRDRYKWFMPTSVFETMQWQGVGIALEEFQQAFFAVFGPS
jgi:hypothetical protein